MRTCDALVAGSEGILGEVGEELLTLLTKSLATVLCPARLPQHLRGSDRSNRLKHVLCMAAGLTTTAQQTA
jgi:hypothetical protein